MLEELEASWRSEKVIDKRRITKEAIPSSGKRPSSVVRARSQLQSRRLDGVTMNAHIRVWQPGIQAARTDLPQFWMLYRRQTLS